VTAPISDDDLRILQGPAFMIPKSRPPGDFGSFLAEQNKLFFQGVSQFRGPLADRLADRAYWMKELSSSLEAVVSWTQRGGHERAWQLMEDILDEHAGVLKLMSLRHAYKVTGSQSWYRLTTWSDAKTRRDVFHLPFELKAASYRFSPPGRPAIYLGNNVYVCWLECLKPSLASCRVARFEIDMRREEYFLDLPTNHHSYLDPLLLANEIEDVNPAMVTNSPYLNDVERELVEYLSTWPLLMAITVEKLRPAPPHPPEYLIPQLLMQWVLKQKDLLGIRYFTTKRDQTNNSNDVSINVVLPTRTTKQASGFCNFLVEKVRCTLPQSFDDATGTPADVLFSAQAADERESAAGRYWVEWEGSWRHYQYTPFGRMEYLLDRPEMPALRIDSE